MSDPQRAHTAVTGLCWGDEGKGKIVDLLSPRFDVVVRYNGGANAGHTVCTGGQTFALHLVPSGVLHWGVTGVIGPGVVLDPVELLSEIDMLAGRGIDIGDNLRISARAHVVTDYHLLEDRLAEQAAGDRDRIGTTARGIGPCYADKMRRNTAIRVCDLLDTRALADRVARIVELKRKTFQALYAQDGDLNAEAVTARLTDCADRLRPFVCDTTAYLHHAIASGRRLLFEGANGMLLDVDHGTFPYVTSSSTGPWGISAGAGVPPQTVQHYVGVTKAYTTRVGGGPFPSELTNVIGDRIRERGREYGTTTGRPRRCGWFDAVAVRYAVQLGGITEIALMHLDTLSGFDRVGICTVYRSADQNTRELPPDAATLERVEPVIEMLPGWTGDLSGIQRFEDLPLPTARYIERIQELVGAPVNLASVGPDRLQTIVRGGPNSVLASALERRTR
ncbi:MAG TPA: adenylosuccinate synthase [Phycisphaerae bacterium]|nr:adenylosuccinate synthase [Phycisphaerae bacterium]